MLKRALLLCVLLIGTSNAIAQEHSEAAPSATASAAVHEGGAAEAADTQPHPALPSDTWWTPIMLVIIAAMFLAAAVIGPIVRTLMPEELPQPHGHDDHAGHGHGQDEHGHHSDPHSHGH
jgi:hypothetical protein